MEPETISYFYAPPVQNLLKTYNHGNGQKDIGIRHHRGGKGDCKRRNITYKTSCDNCKEKNASKGIKDNHENVGTYIGETARSGAERSKEHVEDAKKGKEESHIHKHTTLEHPGEDVTFSMKVIRKHKSCFARQVHEAVLIEMAERENLLNSKNTFNRC